MCILESKFLCGSWIQTYFDVDPGLKFILMQILDPNSFWCGSSIGINFDADPGSKLVLMWILDPKFWCGSWIEIHFDVDPGSEFILIRILDPNSFWCGSYFRNYFDVDPGLELTLMWIQNHLIWILNPNTCLSGSWIQIRIPIQQINISKVWAISYTNNKLGPL